MLNTLLLSNELQSLVGLYPGFTSTSLPAAIHRTPTFYLSDAHRLLRTDVLTALITKPEDILATAYDTTKSYVRYELVKVGTDLFESQLDTNLGKPTTDSASWTKTTPLSAWYSQIVRGAINKLVAALVLSPPTADLLSRQPLYNNESNLSGILNKSGRFIGHRIDVLGKNVGLRVPRIGLQLTGATMVNIPIYLFNSQQSAPIASVRIIGTPIGRTIWTDFNQTLYSNNEGYYLIGYFESDIPALVNVVGAERGFTPGNCSSCYGMDYAYAESRQPFVKISPVFVQNPTTTNSLSWSSESSVLLQTWGLNYQLEAACDPTSAVLSLKEKLVNALLYIIACDVLTELSTTDRVNAVQAKMQSLAYIALKGTPTDTSDTGLTGEKNKILSDLKALTTKLIPVCSGNVPTTPPTGINFESMFDND